jgi:hypothetical protein
MFAAKAAYGKIDGGDSSHLRRIVRGAALTLAALWALATAAPAQAQGMSFHLEPMRDGGRCGAHCPQVIVAEGQITNSTPGEFISFLRENAFHRDLRTVVFLNSQGGYVVASMELGQIFRRIGAATVVARFSPSRGPSSFLTAHCLSACVYAFMGGVKRVSPPGSVLGIHRMFANHEHGGIFGDATVERVYDNGSMARMLARYSSRMGVSGDLIRYAEHISSQNIHTISPSEMARWNLASRNF